MPATFLLVEHVNLRLERLVDRYAVGLVDHLMETDETPRQNVSCAVAYRFFG